MYNHHPTIMVEEDGYTPASEYDGDDDDDDDVVPFEKSCRRWPRGKISESNQYGRADATCNISLLGLVQEVDCLGSSVPTLHYSLQLLIHIDSVPIIPCLHSTRRFGSSRDSTSVALLI